MLGQTSTNPLESEPTHLLAQKTESTMDPQEDNENVKTTPQNVRSSKVHKEYFSVINQMKKVESSKSTSEFLNSCSVHQLTPKTFKEKRKPFDLNPAEQALWNRKAFETEMLLVSLALEKSQRKYEELISNLSDKKISLYVNLTKEEIDLFENKV